MHDSTLHVVIMLGQLVVGLAAFSLVYTITHRPLAALISALITMLATTAFWVWEVSRD